MTKELEELTMNGQMNMLPAVVDFYQKKKAAWTKEGLTESQQLKTAHQINQVLKMISFAIENNRHNDLACALERHVKRFVKTPQEQIRVLGGVEHLLHQGDEALQKILWWYGHYPEVFEEKFSLNKMGFRLDTIKRPFQKAPHPHYSFVPFAKGENFVLSASAAVWDKVKIAQDFPKAEEPKLYLKWTNTKVGKQYAYDKMVYRQALGDLLMLAHRYLGLEEKSHKPQGTSR